MFRVQKMWLLRLKTVCTCGGNIVANIGLCGITSPEVNRCNGIEGVSGQTDKQGLRAARKGGCGRSLALYVARMNCGLSIPELAALADTDPSAASKAIQRMKKRLPCDRKRKSILRKVSAEIGVRET